MATHSSILAWRIPWTEEPGSPLGRKDSDMTERRHFTLHCAIALPHCVFGFCLLMCMSDSFNPDGNALEAEPEWFLVFTAACCWAAGCAC